jgi:copper chaperone CopZ
MHMCAPIEHMCDDLASTPALASALCEGLSTRVHDNPDASFCTDGTVMYMSGFVWEFEGNTCPVLLLPEWALNTRLKYYLGLLIVILMGFGSEALAYLRRTTAAGGGALTCCAPQSVMLRQGLDSTLHVMQIGTGYCLMLVAMTYHIPLFACVLIGLGLGHCFFAHRKVDGLSAGLGGRPEPCCPDTGPILAMGTQQPGSIQDAGVASPVNESLEAGLLERDRRAGRRSSTALDLAAQVRLQVDGMTCGACVKRVQAALKEVDTIDFFDVTLGPPGSARIVCKDRDDGSSSAADEDSVAAAAIAAIEGTGFSARVAGAVLEGAE